MRAFVPLGPTMVSGFVRLAMNWGMHQEEGDTAEMITVEMAEQNTIDTRRIDVLLLHGKQYGRTTIEQQDLVLGLDIEAGLEAAAATKSVAAA